MDYKEHDTEWAARLITNTHAGRDGWPRALPLLVFLGCKTGGLSVKVFTVTTGTEPVRTR